MGSLGCTMSQKHSVKLPSPRINQFQITGQGFQSPISDHLLERSKAETDDEKLKLPIGGITDCFNESIYKDKGNEGSYSKLTTMTKKHIRPSKCPNLIYDIPLTDNQKYGWHLQADIDWAKCDKHPHRNSQMTKF